MQADLFDTLPNLASNISIDELMRQLQCGTPQDAQLARLLELAYAEGKEAGRQDAQTKYETFMQQISDATWDDPEEAEELLQDFQSEADDIF